jgi:hypothetical protein
MPVKSKAQQRLMYAAAANPAVAKRTGVPQKVAAEMIEKTPKASFKRLPARKGK